MTYTFKKVGAHYRNSLTSEGMTWAQNTNTLKALDDPSYLADANPGAVTVFRKFYSPGGQDISNPSNGTTVADQVIAALGGHQVDYIEGYNEVSVDCPGDPGNALNDYINWTKSFVSEIHKRGQKAACFSFAVGKPCNIDTTWAAIAQSGLLSPGGCDAIALHEYWDNAGPSDPWTALRHQKVHEALVSAGYANHPPFLITEMGRDCVYGNNPAPAGSCACGSSQNCAATDGCGWQAQGLSPTQFLDELQAWDNAVANDPTVLGGTVFTHGGGPDCTSFEIDPLAQYLTASPPNPNPVPPPTPTGQGQCIADPDCIAIHGNGYYCQDPGTSTSSCQPCPTSTPAGYVLAQTVDYTPQLIGVGVVAAGIAGIAALVKGGQG